MNRVRVSHPHSGTKEKKGQKRDQESEQDDAGNAVESCGWE